MDEHWIILRRTLVLLPLVAACWVVLVFASLDTEDLRPSAVLLLFLSLAIREHLLGNWPGALLAAMLMALCGTPVIRDALRAMDSGDSAFSSAIELSAATMSRSETTGIRVREGLGGNEVSATEGATAPASPHVPIAQKKSDDPGDHLTGPAGPEGEAGR